MLLNWLNTVLFEFTTAFSFLTKLCEQQQLWQTTVCNGRTAHTLKRDRAATTVNRQGRFNDAFAVLQGNVIDFTKEVIYRLAFPFAEAQI